MNNNRNIVIVGFFVSFEMQATYPVSGAREENFPQYFVQPATSQILFFWETIEREIHVSFTVAKTPWNTASEPASAMRSHFVFRSIQLPECSARKTSCKSCKARNKFAQNSVVKPSNTFLLVSFPLSSSV